MSDIVWQDPPFTLHQGPGGGVRATFVQTLRQNPGRWALYPYPMSAGSAAPKNRRECPGTEWTARKRDDGRYDLYGRWIGGAS